jgi:hypothetical protein
VTPTDHAPEFPFDGVVADKDGFAIGKIGEIYTDNDTGQPRWVTVQTGWFGTHESFVPLDHAVVTADEIRVPFGQDVIKGAPHNEVGAPLAEQDEDELYRYYSIDSPSPAASDGAPGDPDIRTPDVEPVRNEPGTAAGIPAHAGSSPAGGQYLAPSEQPWAGTGRAPIGRPRLRKFVVTNAKDRPHDR